MPVTHPAGSGVVVPVAVGLPLGVGPVGGVAVGEASVADGLGVIDGSVAVGVDVGVTSAGVAGAPGGTLAHPANVRAVMAAMAAARRAPWW
ncbi:hypothetical protein G7070_08810 [Propioniciclava coleopterorum]|uniref:Uncharacterized protein n=1 Tax=Propioniciclava coleopterorum TaxID=2714937 RepID=A0A6G7Y633_9ACTN|nr:hypothetical protein [Propioniciclava coleopterorum]QIK72354.1 hypothetical protein G7070_08810 [Propioniciclava coleopterorum]